MSSFLLLWVSEKREVRLPENGQDWRFAPVIVSFSSGISSPKNYFTTKETDGIKGVIDCEGLNT